MNIHAELDPHIHPLREALGTMQGAVAAGGITPESANRYMGQVADALVKRDYGYVPRPMVEDAPTRNRTTTRARV